MDRWADNGWINKDSWTHMYSVTQSQLIDLLMDGQIIE